MKHYAHFGFDDFVLCLGYRGAMIKDYFLNFRAQTHDFSLRLADDSSLRIYGDEIEDNFAVTCADTGLDTLTGGRIKRIARYLNPDEPFFLTYGDGLSDVNIQATLDFHRSHGNAATLTICARTVAFWNRGVERRRRSHAICRKTDARFVGVGGFFVLEPRVLDFIEGDATMWEREPLETLAQSGELMAYRHDGMFLAIDTYREYLLLQEAWKRGDAPWKVW